MKKALVLVLLAALLLPAPALAEGDKPDAGKSFSILVDDSGLVEDKIMLPILEEQTGIHVDFMLLPYEAAVERKNILITSGDYPDAIGGWLLGENDILTLGMTDGLFVPLDEYMNDTTPNMQTVLAIPGVKDAFTLPDGHIYTIPYVIGEPLVTFLPFINTDWLKAVNMEMPTTTDEFAAVLRAFKAQDANGNGDPNDEIPFSADPNNKDLGVLAGYFGVNASNSGQRHYCTLVDGKVFFGANQPGYKEFIKWFAGLYAEGLIDPELFTQDLATWKAKGAKSSNLYGVSIAYGSGDYYEMEPGTNYTPFAPLPVLKSDFAETPVFRRNGYGVTYFRSQVAVTDKAEDPGLIVRWFDNVFDLDNSMQIQAGLYGKRLERLEDGSFRYLDETLMSEADREKYGWGNMFCQSLPKFCPVEIKIAPVVGQPLPYAEKDTADALYAPYLDEPLPKPWLQAADAERMSTLATDIVNYVDQKMAQWISGEADVEAEWDAYCAQLETLGLQELIDIKQKALDTLEK
ncbi:MAG: extracellular solute-binding protein [Clostridiales bacterium]|nr:extracellular solute-binding protein [Clostridiales bacterium]